jgi:class 3 adenylate cyclase
LQVGVDDSTRIRSILAVCANIGATLGIATPGESLQCAHGELCDAIVFEAEMKARTPNLIWLGAGLAAAYWVGESLLHTLVFNDGSLVVTLLGEQDPNELWMRVLIAIAFLAFGWIAERSRQAERHMKDDAKRLSSVLRFVDQVQQKFPLSGLGRRLPPQMEQLLGAAAAAPGPMPEAEGPREAPDGIRELAISEDDFGRLARILQELSQVLDERFEELHALLQVTHEINKGLLLEEVLEKAYQTLQSVLPYNRLSVALLEKDGQILRARWAKADYPDLMLRTGYSGAIQGSSLQGIIASGEPRIINDLVQYFELHPSSNSTHLMISEGIRSSLTCPLVSMGKPIGFMFFASVAANSYKNVHIDVFKLIVGHLSVMVEKSNLYQQILEEKEKSERLLLNVMPARIAARLRSGAKSVAENLPEINILFVDIVAFTKFAGRYPPERVVHLLENVFAPFDRLCVLYGIEKIKTSGDQYMVMSGHAGSDKGRQLGRLAEFALEALGSMQGMRYPDGTALEIRLGMHTGPAVAGVIGQTKFAYDIWGDAVNIASRMESSGVPGRIHVTEEIYAKLKSEFVFEERGAIDIKGMGLMRTYFLVEKIGNPAKLRAA